MGKGGKDGLSTSPAKIRQTAAKHAAAQGSGHAATFGNKAPALKAQGTVPIAGPPKGNDFVKGGAKLGGAR